MRYLLILLLCLFSACDQVPQGIPQRTGTTREVRAVARQETDVITGTDGLTVEQRNIKHRIEIDNKPGAMKHLYIINAQGKCIFYDAVKGKVTSSQKRLYPTNFYQDVNPRGAATVIEPVENLGYDGTYGSSSEYIYWWNVNDQYRQLQIGNTCTVLVTEVPVKFTEVEMDLSVSNNPQVK